MEKVEIVPYNEADRAEYIEMFVEYGNWLDSQVLNHYGVHQFQISVRETIERLVPQFTSIKPPEGDILFLKVDGIIACMARFDKFDDGIGFVHNVWTNPNYRRRGYASQLMSFVEDKAREYGYRFLRLDHGGFNVPAHRMYENLGYKKIDRFTDFDRIENDPRAKYYLDKVYMEKKL